MSGDQHTRTGSLSALVQASTEWEHEPVPVGAAMRRFLWCGTAAASLCTAWLTLGGWVLSGKSLAGWPVGGEVVRWSLMGSHRELLVAAGVALVVAGLALAALTAGFREAGPRLQRIMFGYAGISSLGVVPLGAALAAAVVTAVLFVIAVVIIVVLVGGVLLSD